MGRVCQGHRIGRRLRRALVLVAGMLYVAFRTFPRGHRVRRAATWAGILIILEALLGAGLVVFELVGGNTSVTRAVVGAAHLLNTFLLLASVGLACSWSTWEPGPILPMGRGLSFWLTLGLLGILFIGMTGVIAALGDTLFPPMSIAEGFIQDIDPSSHFLLRLRGFHPVIALAISFLLIALARAQRVGRGSAWRITGLLIVLTVIQIIAGVLNVFLLAPIWLQLVHLLLADTLWITFVLFTDRSLRADIGLMAHDLEGEGDLRIAVF